MSIRTRLTVLAIATLAATTLATGTASADPITITTTWIWQ